MAITPETVKNREFSIRLKGYDPDEVRAFLEDVSKAYRATIRDGGAEWALQNVNDDMAAVLRAAHVTAEGVLSTAEAEAAKIRVDAKTQAAVVRVDAENDAKSVSVSAAAVAADAHQAKDLLDEAATRAEAIVTDAQDTAVQILADVEAVTQLREQLRSVDKKRASAAQHYHETRQASEEMMVTAQAQADRLRGDADDYAASRRREAMADREEARITLERAREEAHSEADMILAAATEGARTRVEETLADGQARLESLARNETVLQERLRAAQEEFQEIMARLGTTTTIDLTDDDGVLVYQGVPTGESADEGDAEMDDATQDMVSSAVGRAVQQSLADNDR